MKLHAERRPRLGSPGAPLRRSRKLRVAPRGALTAPSRDFQQQGRRGREGVAVSHAASRSRVAIPPPYTRVSSPRVRPVTHTPHPPPGGQGCVAQPPAWKGLFKSCPTSGERRGAGTGRRRGPPGRAWGSGSGRGSPRHSYVCQGAADAAARDKVKGERRDRGQTRQPPRWEAAPRSTGSANPAKAGGRGRGGTGGRRPREPGPPRGSEAGGGGGRRLLSRRSRAQIASTRPPIPPPLRAPPRPSASRSPSCSRARI